MAFVLFLALPSLLLFAPPLPPVEPASRLLIASTTSTLLLPPVSTTPSITPSAISTTSSWIVSLAWILSPPLFAVGCVSSCPAFSDICDTAANTVPNLPASSLAATVVLRLVGMVAVKSTPLRPKAVATKSVFASIVPARSFSAN